MTGCLVVAGPMGYREQMQDCWLSTMSSLDGVSEEVPSYGVRVAGEHLRYFWALEAEALVLAAEYP